MNLYHEFSTTVAIRIEHSSGKGLWRATFKDNDFMNICNTFSFFNELSKRHDTFPTPREDGIDIQSNQYCAFKSIQDLYKWMDSSWFKEMKENDFKILMLDLKDCIVLKEQILYKKEDIIRSKDISRIFS